MVKRPLVGRPTVVALPGHIAALKKQVARTIIAYDENDVTLKSSFFGCKFAQVDTAKPILWDLKLNGRFPFALAQTVFADLRVRLSLALNRRELLHEASAGSAVIACTIDLQIELRHRIRAHHHLERLARRHARLGTIALDARGSPQLHRLVHDDLVLLSIQSRVPGLAFSIWIGFDPATEL